MGETIPSIITLGSSLPEGVFAPRTGASSRPNCRQRRKVSAGVQCSTPLSFSSFSDGGDDDDADDVCLLDLSIHIIITTNVIKQQ